MRSVSCLLVSRHFMFSCTACCTTSLRNHSIVEAGYTTRYGCYDIYQPRAYGPRLINIVATLTSLYNLYFFLEHGKAEPYTMGTNTSLTHGQTHDLTSLGRGMLCANRIRYMSLCFTMASTNSFCLSRLSLSLSSSLQYSGTQCYFTMI